MIINVLVTVIIYGELIMVFEKPISHHHNLEDASKLYLPEIVKNHFYAYYLVFITISTVGYGDVTTNSTMGTNVCCLIALNGAVILSTFVVIGSSILNLSN